MKPTALKLNRKICDTHLPEPFLQDSMAWMGENSQLLTSSWRMEEEWDVSPMFWLFIGLPKALVSVLHESECWQEQSSSWGQLRTKAINVHQSTEPQTRDRRWRSSTVTYCSTRDAAVQDKDTRGSSSVETGNLQIGDNTHKPREDTSPERAWEVSRMSSQAYWRKSNCKDWKRWQIL